MYTFVQNKLLFLQKFIQSPKQIGSVIPSSKFLANRMIQLVDTRATTNIAELGSGTGAITRYFPQITTRRSRVFLFEKDAELRNSLMKKYPHYHHCAEATEMVAAIRDKGVEQLDCIISGLPYFNFSQSVRDKLLEQIVLSLKPNGQFIAFQYSLQMKEQLSQYFDIEAIHFELMNVPPAFVYACRKRRD
ncbi:Phospholipid N-methyltransferase [Paenibacillus sp. UNCCL117]|uniref:class I SAM-dependent methyltransferase n=1 Tax=unclassified Paenibacillus TaxID=185978 RepID=UPI00088DED1E|nr:MULTISPECIES: phospholipid methyltransferase [unclassified Paenibacillus]SDC91838.1 Phospholipid N-methyltransferase [Paenibacillus sp. cl123]SFW29176.1 Phospholipid N-methyltransferase [Paenibacillus sp. UNCCL117]